ncbi:hypothetical protein D3C84_1047270 [compost metagenome]
MSQLRLAFGLVDCGVGRCVNDNVRRKALHGGGQPRQIIEVAAVFLAGGVQRQHFTKGRKAALQLPPHLAVLAEQ